MTLAAAISIGNSSVQIGRLVEGTLEDVDQFDLADEIGPVDAVAAWFDGVESGDRATIVASVNPAADERLRDRIATAVGGEILEIERDLAAPIGRGLDPGASVGVDRLLAAAAAWDELKQACIVIDAGTAVTVDFVDGEGMFQGGAILPGVASMLDAVHRDAALLPETTFAVPEGEPWGRDTEGAIQRGVEAAIAGGAWKLVEKYALHYGGFPLVVATGGDAQVLFRDDELVSRVVPDLVLRGMAIAWRTATEGSDA